LRRRRRRRPDSDEDKDNWDLVEALKEEAPELLIAFEEKTIEWCGRIPNEPDDKWAARLKRSTNRLAERMKLPNVKISPFWACVVILAVLWAQMFYNADKKTPKAAPPAAPPKPAPPQSPADTSASVGGTDETRTSSESPSSSGPPALSLVPEGGSATNALKSSPAE
jgi:hypothetical protein